MQKHMLVFALFMSLIFSGVAQASETPSWYSVPRGATVESVAKKFSLTVSQLLHLNKGVQMRPGHPLIVGEQLNVNPKTDPEWLGLTVWQFIGADVYGPSLVPLLMKNKMVELNDSLRTVALAVIDSLLPEAEADFMTTQVQIQDPKIVQIYSGEDSVLVLDNLIFGGYEIRSRSGKMERSKVKVWRGGVACLWKKRAKTNLSPVTSQYAAIWDPITVPGSSKKYKLLVFLECRNGATISYDVVPEPVVVVVPETTRVVVPSLPQDTVRVEPLVPLPPTPLYAWQQRCSHTLTGEGVHLDEGPSEYEQRTANYFYVHAHEWWGCQQVGSARMDRFGFGMTNELAGYGVDYHANTMTGNVRGGPLLVPYYGHGWWIQIEGGPGWEATQRDYWTSSSMDDGRIRLTQHKRWTDGPLVYGRFQVFGPHRSGLNLQYRQGRLMEERFGQLTTRPGRFLGQVTYQKQNRHEVHRHVEGGTIVFPEDMTVLEGAKLGYRPTNNLTIFASINKYWYWSEIFQYDHRGPGGGFELKLSPLYKFDLHAMRLNNHDNAYLPIVQNGERVGTNVIHTENNEWRLLVSFGYNSGRRQYHVHEHAR